MTRTRSLLIAGLLLAVGAAPGLARPPAEILDDLEAMKAPAFDGSKRGDQDYLAEYRAELSEFNEAKAALILELYEEDPAHDRIATLLPERWQLLQRTGKSETALQETESLLQQPMTPDALRADAGYWSAMLVAGNSSYNLDETMPAIERFMQLAPEDDRAVRLLMGVAGQAEDPDLQMKLYRRSLALFPDSKYNKYTGGKIKQAESLGLPLELTFTDAATGKQISLQRDLRGKVVVLDFWATWCGPCIAEMPHMKELYDEYSGRGVEFIGVSLDAPADEGGLDKLLAYVKDNDIRWPQYYQGAGWEGEFSTQWGINSIPALFVVDSQGRLHSVNARGKLEEMIPELLTQRDSG
jgi:thiol-disulfide isomerase/thioredoxin